MKVFRIVLIVIGWCCIILEIMGNFLVDSFRTENGVGYSVGYALGRHFFLILGGLLFFFAYRIKKKLRGQQRESEINSFLKD
ncbi:MAG: hypothetical protein JST75_17895 [Bacteroidetes bacterium]|nr:hypothetical protein [Bacteroidota bacterium]